MSGFSKQAAQLLRTVLMAQSKDKIDAGMVQLGVHMRGTSFGSFSVSSVQFNDKQEALILTQDTGPRQITVVPYSEIAAITVAIHGPLAPEKP